MIALYIITALLSLCSTAILSYISMAFMIGPWIESTVALLAQLLLFLTMRNYALANKNQPIYLITIGASIGGILATGCGFAFPTLYFLDPALFNSWLSSPVYFIAIMTSLAFLAGALGLFIANLLERYLIDQKGLPFPIGEVTYKLINAQNSITKSFELAAGFTLSIVYALTQKFLIKIPNVLTITPSFSIRSFIIPALPVALTELPMLLAIGFIAGSFITFSLGTGILAKIFFINPLHSYYFNHLSLTDFSFAFNSGMITYGVVLSLLELPKIGFNYFKHFCKTPGKIIILKTNFLCISLKQVLLALVYLLSFFLFLSYFKFSLISQLYLLIFTSLCSYQIAIIAGEMGLAPLARFATYVMIPGISLFGFNPIQITLVSTFVEVCGGITADMLFGRKTAQLSMLEKKQVLLFQWLGLVVSALSVGICFYVLITKLGLGSKALLAQRSQSRALLVNFKSFNALALTLGALFGAFLKECKINPIMVLGGILMPLDWSLPLFFGSLLTFLVKNPDNYHPFWSGIFAATSLWMIIKNFI